MPVLETVDDFDAIFRLLVLSHEVDIGRVGWLLLVDERGDVKLELQVLTLLLVDGSHANLDDSLLINELSALQVEVRLAD